MRLKGIIVLVVASGILLGCSASKNVLDTNPELDAMVDGQKVEFNASFARPTVTNAMSQIGQSGLFPPGSNITRIDLGGSGNYLKIDGDMVSANLAYYGERQFGGGYNSNTGIKFNGKPEALEISKDDTKKSYILSFEIREQMETFKVRMKVSTNLSATVDIISSHRTRIGYTGRANALPEKG